MKNVKQTVKGSKLIIEVDLSKSFGETKSGKSDLIATTSGNSKVDGKPDITFGLNVFKKKT